jgi:hypothetical protein
MDLIRAVERVATHATLDTADLRVYGQPMVQTRLSLFVYLLHILPPTSPTN